MSHPATRASSVCGTSFRRAVSGQGDCDSRVAVGTAAQFGSGRQIRTDEGSGGTESVQTLCRRTHQNGLQNQ